MFEEIPGTCSFIHKRLGGALGGFFGGGPLGAALGFFGGGGGANQVPGNQGNCPAGFKQTRDGGCTDATGEGRGLTGSRGTGAQLSFGPLPTFPPAPGTAVGPLGSASFGGVSQPISRPINRRECPRRHVLGANGLCYPKGAIKNSDRWWPKPRRPLLTGGDLNAIAIASRAAKRLESATKRLQGMGMMKKPSRGRARGGRGGHLHAIAAPTQTLRVISEETN